MHVSKACCEPRTGLLMPKWILESTKILAREQAEKKFLTGAWTRLREEYGFRLWYLNLSRIFGNQTLYSVHKFELHMEWWDEHMSSRIKKILFNTNLWISGADLVI